jgi:PIN domain nuclease of toxin-antitoxin system
MRLLLDTHTLLWALTDPKHLSPRVRSLIADGRNEIGFSAAAILEIAVSRAAGRRNAPKVPGERVAGLARQAGYEMLPVTDAHAAAVETIAPFHGDPFDRLLLAQAQIEGFQLVTHDEALAAYDNRTILF